MADLDDDYLPPAQVLSAQTLVEWSGGGTGVRADDLIATIGTPAGTTWMGQQDPAIQQLLGELAVEGVDDPDERDAPASDLVPGLLSTAVQAGYLLGRTVLGTDRLTLRWSSDPDDDAGEIGEVIASMEIIDLASSAGGDIFQASTDLAERLVPATFGDDEREKLDSDAVMAFDNGLAAALLEHDRQLGRVAPAGFVLP